MGDDDDRQIGLLVVDDEDDVRLLVRLTIEAHSSRLAVVREAASGEEALAMLDSTDPCVVVLDQRMSGMTGLEVAARIRESRPQLPIILFSAFVDDDLEAEARSIGVTACLLKSRVRELPEMVLSIAG